MLRLLYNALWYPALPFALAFARGADARGLRERLGLAAPRLGDHGPRLWVHAASVGEVEAVCSIVTRLLRDSPGARAVMTCMTAAGRDVACRRIPRASACLLAPLDCPASVRAFLRRVRPDLVLIAESELWPNYFFEARRVGAKIVVVNGRMSKRSFARYRRLKPLFGRALGCAEIVMAQSEADALRFARLGVGRGRIVVTGNTKFDPDAEAHTPLRRELVSFAAGRPILIAGSTAPGEEEIVLAAYRTLRAHWPALALVLAPRHLARVPEVERIVSALGLECVRATAQVARAGADVMILDTMGELRALYRRATVAFVGGSLVGDRGGQNPAEPASVRVPVLFGPHYENQRDIASALIDAGGARVVSSAQELAQAAAKWLGDEEQRLCAGRTARACVDRLSGGVNASLMHLRTLISLS